MAIFYVLIAKRNNVVLADYTAHTGNFQVITMQLLEQIQPDTAKTLELEEFHFHYTQQNGILVLCMSSKDVQQKLAFTFLQDVKQAFYDTYTQRDIDNAVSYSLKSFGVETMKPKMSMYNDNPTMVKDKADVVLENMINLKEDMVENIENLIQRDGKIEIIAEKALQLSTVSNSYKQRSKKLKEQERCKRRMYTLVCIFIVIACAGFVIFALFGGDKDAAEKEEAQAIAAIIDQQDGFLQQTFDNEYYQKIEYTQQEI